MSRSAAWLAACLLIPRCAPAAGDAPPAPPPFETITEQPTPHRSYLGAYLTMLAGGALIGASFDLSHKADDTYGQYLVETDPARIDQLYDRTLAYDRWGRAALLGGEGVVAVGLYLRFLRRPAPQRAMLELSPQRCALFLRF